MSNALAIVQPADNQQHQALVPIDLNEIESLGAMLSKSGYFADARDAAQAGVKVLAGRELGIPPVASMMGINIIKGKVALGANLIASRIRAHGYDYRIKEHTNKGCKVAFYSRPSNGKREELGISEFNEESAKAAQCFSDMYKKYPQNMYFARAISNGARFYCPEIFGGAPVYTPEELGASIDENGEMVRESEQIAAAHGQQPGTKAAADAVAAKKIADAPPTAKAADPEWRKNFQGLMNGALELLGEEKFMDVLQAASKALSKEINKPVEIRGLSDIGEKKTANFVWAKHMSPAMDAEKARRAAEPAEAIVVEDREDWVPDNIGGADGDLALPGGAQGAKR